MISRDAATNLVQETPKTTNKPAKKKKMIEEETSTQTPQTWTLDSHQNQSSNFVKSLYKYGVFNGRQSTPELQPKTQIIIRSNPSDEEAIKDLEQVLMKKFFVFCFPFFLSLQPPSIPHQCLGGC
jgi:hypothetical protein